MEQYIDKSEVVAELERRISLLKKEKKIEKWSAGASQMNVVSLGARIAMLEEILTFLDTLEVKETLDSDDLEQEIENELERTWCGEYLDTDKFRESAKHFFELGLKAKGE